MKSPYFSNSTFLLLVYIFLDLCICEWFLLLLLSHVQIFVAGLQDARLPCPSLFPGVCSNPCPLSWWRHPTISSSVALFSSCPQSFPASESFPIYNEECFCPDFLEGSFQTQNYPSDRSIFVIHSRFSGHAWIYANEATLGGLLVSGWRPAVLERPSMRLQGCDLKPCDKKLDLWGGKWG